MSYKLNQQDPTRRQRLLDRRNKQTLDAPLVPHDKVKRRPAFVKAQGTPMSGKTQRALMSHATRHKLKDTIIIAVYHGSATKQEVYGYHPTKGNRSCATNAVRSDAVCMD